MTPEDNQRIRSLHARVTKNNIDRFAESQVLIEVVSQMLAEGDDEAAAHAKATIRQKIKERQEKYLLYIETLNPGWAALMDEDTPLPPPA